MEKKESTTNMDFTEREEELKKNTIILKDTFERFDIGINDVEVNFGFNPLPVEPQYIDFVCNLEPHKHFNVDAYVRLYVELYASDGTLLCTHFHSIDLGMLNPIHDISTEADGVTIHDSAAKAVIYMSKGRPKKTLADLSYMW